uniref:BBSome-interacting protein 1 n=1 Tax=Anas zonorhyncha TaxID=75864 RepID=A0A8B9VTT4_9AVES
REQAFTTQPELGRARSPSHNTTRARGKAAFREVLPKQGQLSTEDVPAMVLCKPKVLPLKSVALEKLEELQRAAAEAAARASEGAPGSQR